MDIEPIYDNEYTVDSGFLILNFSWTYQYVKGSYLSNFTLPSYSIAICFLPRVVCWK